MYQSRMETAMCHALRLHGANICIYANPTSSAMSQWSLGEWGGQEVE
jgi:hypothetical protein